MEDILLKRIYDPYHSNDGYRILVDRLWPRGISKENAKIDMWAKEIGPSNELRKWFGHKAELFDEFHTKYLKELRNKKEASLQLKKICQIASTCRVTLLFAAKDPNFNNAQVLKQEILKILSYPQDY